MSNISRPICTRCGYPLTNLEKSGAQQTFRCPECGTAYTAENLARESAQRWLFEIHGARRPVGTVARAVIASFRPGRFWRIAAMESGQVVLRPVALAVLIPLVISTVLGAFSMFWYIVVHQRISHEPVSVQLAMLGNMLLDFMQLVGTVFIGPAVITLFMPVPFLIAQSTRRLRGITSQHLFRVMLYSFVWPAWLALVWCIAFFGLLLFNRPDMAVYLTPYIFENVLPTPIWMPAAFIFVVTTVLYGLYASWWWLQASWHYLQLEHSFLVVFCACVLSLCGAWVAQFWIALA